MENKLTLSDTFALDYDNPVFNDIKKLHKKVSNIKTPKRYIKKKLNLDYVDYSYMRQVADEQYPGWSWNIIKTELIGDKAFMVHGRLLWIDNGLLRQGDVTAAHRIQRKTDNSDYVDIGNDIKAANTDAIKKAFNMFLNIADDVYKNTEIELFEDKDKLKELILKVTNTYKRELWLNKLNTELTKEEGEELLNKIKRELPKTTNKTGETNG